jgi:cytochrome c-type biogenesis protein CcmH/NrfG
MARHTPKATKTPAPSVAPAAPAPSAGAGRLFWFGAGVCFVLSLALYIKTMAASSSFWDSGEFIATAYTLGIPHSPGTPLYVLVGRVFTLLPLWFFSIAQRVNLLSAFCGAVGVFFVYLLVVRFLDVTMGKSRGQGDAVIKVVGGLVGALFIAFSDTYWNNAIEAEVYAMSTALMGFMTWLALRWGDDPKSQRSTYLVLLLFYLLALSVGFHLGTILAISGIFFFVLMTREKGFTDGEFVLACVGVGIFVADATIYRNGRLTLLFLGLYGVAVVWMWTRGRRFPAVATGLFLLGLSVHLYLKIRSGHNPSIDEGNPETWRNLYWVLRREQYPPMNVLKRKAGLLFQLGHFNRYFQSQFQLASVYVAKLNVGSLIPLALGVWGMVDQFTKDRKTWVMLFVTTVVVSLGLVVFLNFSATEVRERDYFYSPAFYYFAVYIGIGAASLLGELRGMLERRGARTAPAVYGLAVVLVVLPLFTLKAHYFTHDRSRNYTCPAYARNMLIGLDKDAILFTNGDNDTFPLWYIQEVEGYRTDVKVVNLSLLNTTWYIKQCRDNEPKVPIRWTDEEINRLTPIYTEGHWMLIRDIAVAHILRANNWQRPIYFAVTIPSETYAPYREILEFEGLAYKVVRRRGKNMVNKEKVVENILHKFDYSSILTEDWKRDRSVYLPPYTEHLIQNYAAALFQLAAVQHDDSLFDDAVRSLEAAREISPNMQPIIQLLGWYYLDRGDTNRAIQFFKEEIQKQPGNLDLRFRLAGVYERSGQREKSLEQLEMILRVDPNDDQAMMAAVGIAIRIDRIDRARQILSEWLRKHPNDVAARQTLEDIEAQMQPDRPSLDGQ